MGAPSDDNPASKLVVRGELELYDSLEDFEQPIEILPGGRLVLAGRSSNRIVIHEGGTARVLGVANDVWCAGEFELVGMLVGTLEVVDDGEAWATAGASWVAPAGGTVLTMRDDGMWSPSERAKSRIIFDSMPRWRIDPQTWQTFRSLTRESDWLRGL